MANKISIIDKEKNFKKVLTVEVKITGPKNGQKDNFLASVLSDMTYEVDGDTEKKKTVSFTRLGDLSDRKLDKHQLDAIIKMLTYGRQWIN